MASGRAGLRWVWGIGAAVLLCSVVARAEGPAATVRVRCIDEATGQVTPAMACVTGVDDGKVRLPPDGRILEGPGTRVDAFVKGIEFQPDPDWIGVVRKTLGKGDNTDRSYVYEERPSVPYWREPFTCLTSGDFSIRLPAGRWRLTVSHGNEYVPVVEEFAVAAGDSPMKTVLLRRWIDLPRRGWYSGDVHVHHPTWGERHRQFLMHYAVAEDLHVVNLLEMGHHKGTEFKQAGFGKAYRQQQGSYALVSGQEDPRSTFGHIIGLNIKSVARNTLEYDLYDRVFDEVHRQGGLIGYAHLAWNGCDLPRGFPWYVTTGGIDFVELLQFNTINRLDYYDYLNLGFKLTAAAGSDVPWGSTIGEVRTYVHTGPQFDVDKWFAGLKAGRTFVSNGPALEMTVDGQLPGSDIALPAPGKVSVVAKAVGHAKVGLPVKLTIANGDGVVRETERSESSGDSLELRLDVAVERSGWLVGAVVCDNGAVAHTSPFYLVVDGRPFWHPSRGPAVIERLLGSIRKIREEVDKGPDDARAKALRARLGRAERFYADLTAKMVAEPARAK